MLDAASKIIVFVFLISSLNFYNNSYAATIAVIDSNFDISHQDLNSKLQFNYNETKNKKDDDNNGYIDDLIGWNFYKNNNVIFDYESNKSFSKDIKQYYFLKWKKAYEGLSKEEEDWVEAIKEDKTFKFERSMFSRFSHGTHVAGVAVKDISDAPYYSQNKMIPIKLYGDKLDWPMKKKVIGEPVIDDFNKTTKSNKLKKELREIAYEVSFRNMNSFLYAKDFASVVNGSYGTSQPTIDRVVKKEFKKVYKRYPKEWEQKKYRNYYIEKLESKALSAIKKAHNALFVFSAGNKKASNDEVYHFPSNFREKNVLAVAASFEFESLAYFSNYGEKMVDLAAPGVAIESSIPGNRYIYMNGTSQAAPFVSNVAGHIFNILKNTQYKKNAGIVKKILMNTVDFKKELRKKVVSGGIINPRRAFFMAKNINKLSYLSWESLVELSRSNVKDIVKDNTLINTKLVDSKQALEASELPDPMAGYLD